MIFILALLPALGWGLMPIIAQWNKGKPNEQLLGTTITALLFGGVIAMSIDSEWSLLIVVISFLSGVCWSIGQYLQFYSFLYLPVSEAMPISNGTQLIGTTLVAAIFFNEWTGRLDVFMGIISLLFIIGGIYLTNYHEKDNTQVGTFSLKPVFILLVSSLSLTVYVVLPKFFNIPGASIIFPQAIGMFTAAFLMNLPYLKTMNYQRVFKNMSTGLAWSIANFSLFLTIPYLGVGKSFTISQLSVLVTLITSTILFKINKSQKEKKAVLIGAVLITIGILLISLLKK